MCGVGCGSFAVRQFQFSVFSIWFLPDLFFADVFVAPRRLVDADAAALEQSRVDPASSSSAAAPPFTPSPSPLPSSRLPHLAALSPPLASTRDPWRKGQISFYTSVSGTARSGGGKARSGGEDSRLVLLSLVRSMEVLYGTASLPQQKCLCLRPAAAT